MSEDKTITVDQLLAHAYAIEREAQSRYADLADQMQIHNNQELAELFGKRAEIEALHAAKIKQRAAGAELPYVSPPAFRWPGGEERAVASFEDTAEIATDNASRALAEEFAEEEREHVALMKDWLAKYPAPEPGWDDDHDPPVIQE